MAAPEKTGRSWKDWFNNVRWKRAGFKKEPGPTGVASPLLQFRSWSTWGTRDTLTPAVLSKPLTEEFTNSPVLNRPDNEKAHSPDGIKENHKNSVAHGKRTIKNSVAHTVIGSLKVGHWSQSKCSARLRIFSEVSIYRSVGLNEKSLYSHGMSSKWTEWWGAQRSVTSLPPFTACIILQAYLPTE